MVRSVPSIRVVSRWSLSDGSSAGLPAGSTYPAPSGDGNASRRVGSWTARASDRLEIAGPDAVEVAHEVGDGAALEPRLQQADQERDRQQEVRELRERARRQCE